MNRFGLGAGLGDRQALGDPKGWLRAQVERGVPAAAPTPDAAELGEVLRDFRDAQRSRDTTRRQAASRRVRDVFRVETEAMLTRRVTSEVPYLERLVAFWSNHLCVSVRRQQVQALAGHYERTVVRQNVLGSYSDMVTASAKHPAMLFYLDNLRSIGPRSLAAGRAARAGRERGLNENYARELLELHTLGVDGGYTQADVEQLARVLTGWSVQGHEPVRRRPPPVGFVFLPQVHEPDDKTVLGKRYDEAGVREGEQAIRDLCAHPSTATFVAQKLVRHFVADDPPVAAVERVASVFSASEGDLKRVSSALIDLDEAWDPAQWKFRTPQDWLVAVFRTFNSASAPESMTPLLTQLRHPPWAPSAPKGYGDSRREWADPDALMNRAELARTLAARVARAAPRLQPEMLLDVVDVSEADPLRAMLADSRIPRRERLALALGGPAFQWR